MTYKSPTTGDRVGLSFIIPRTQDDLVRRREMMLRWARATCGMMGRSPDFMNVTFAAWAASADYFARGRPQFADNMRRYYEHIRENDLVLTHSLINLQRSRNVSGLYNLEEGTALHCVRETDAGIVVRGARVLATLGPFADEIAVYSPRVPLHTDGHNPFALNFAIPCSTKGLRFLCRDSFDQGRSHFDYPLSSRFDEMDCVVFFDDVLVPWERVFLLGDVELLNKTGAATNFSAPLGSPGRRQEPRQVRVRARRCAADDRDARQCSGAAHRVLHRRAHAHDLAHEGLHSRCGGGCQARSMGRHVSRSRHDRKHAQSVHDGLSAHDRDPSSAGISELHDHAEQSRLRWSSFGGHRAVPRDRQEHGP